MNTMNSTVPLKTKLLRITSSYLYFFGVSTCLACAITNYYFAKKNQIKQVESWSIAFPNSIITHLIDSDYSPIDGKLRMIFRSGIFSNFEVYDNSKYLISSFGDRPSFHESRDWSNFEIRDESGGVWGSFRYIVNEGMYIAPLVISTLIIICLSFFATFILRKVLFSKFSYEFYNLEEIISRIESLSLNVEWDKFDNSFDTLIEYGTLETSKLDIILRRFVIRIHDYQSEISKSQIERQRHILLTQIAQQVAHDIRSPIAALTVVTQMLDNVPEDQRILIRQAVQRIEDIANDLASTKSKSEVQTDLTESKSVAPQMLSGILDLIVSEKRMQYRSRGNLRIDCNINDKSYGLFANIHENTFKRVFSNLINNAVEVLGDNGHIEVNLLSENSNLLIQVKDNGKGIAPDILPKLMQRGETHGKKEGKGLGLFHARETIEGWGGSMEIRSELGKGTEVRILLPKVIAPDWFLPELRLGQTTRVIVIDDDSSIHQIWTGRFKAPQYKSNPVVHFSSAQAVLDAHAKTPDIFIGDVVILCDLELRGEEINGLTLMRTIKATDKTVLVTSRFEEPHVRAECKELGIKLIPKNLAGFVPIIVGKTEEKNNGAIDAVLIDDQDMIHKTWQMMAKIKKINLASFHTPEEFFAKCGALDKNCRIFIDSNLADGVKGEVIAKDIYAKGFERIYLATGSDKSEFPPMPWIMDIVGKQPML